MAMEIDEVIDEIKSIVTVNTEKQAEALNWAVNYMTLLKSALKVHKDRKVEKLAMLEELKKEIDKQCKIPNKNASAYDWNNGVYACYKVVQSKIDKLKG